MMEIREDLFDNFGTMESPYFRWKKAEPKGCISYSSAYCECPECHEVVFLGWRFNYCPHCGRCMVEKS